MQNLLVLSQLRLQLHALQPFAVGQRWNGHVLEQELLQLNPTSVTQLSYDLKQVT